MIEYLKIFSLSFLKGEEMINHYPKNGGNPMRVGTFQIVNGEVRRFLCYCGHCGKKITPTQDDLKEILRQGHRKHLVDTKAILPLEKTKNFLQNLRHLRIRVVDKRISPKTF